MRKPFTNMYEKERKEKGYGLGLGPVHQVMHWTWLDGDTCLKVDYVIISTGPILLNTRPKPSPTMKGSNMLN